MQRSGIMGITAFLIMLAVFNFCAALSPVGYSDLLGGIGGTTVTSSVSEEFADEEEATNPIPTVNSLINTLGVVGIVLSLVLAFVAVSFMTRRNWAYIAVMVVLGLYVVLGIIGTVARADIDTLSPVQIILMLISGFVVLYMLTNEELKQQYMEPK